MSKLHMVVVAQFLCRDTNTLMPFLSFIFPEVVPFHLCAGANEKLHFHLFKLTHAENKLAGNNFITESFACLRNTKRNFHPARFLHVEKVYKNTLCSFRA